MDEKFVIVEVLTSADYQEAVILLWEAAARHDEFAASNRAAGWLESAAEEEAQAEAARKRAARFENVAAQVREQEAKTHGL